MSFLDKSPVGQRIGALTSKVKVGASLRIKLVIGFAAMAILPLVLATIIPSVTLMIVVVFLAIIIGFILAGRFSRPIAEMAEIAGKMAAGDLSGKIAVRGEREFASLANSINTMSLNLKEAFRKIAATSTDLGNAVKVMEDATHKMSESAQVQEEYTNNAASVMNEMVASIKGVAENAGEMSAATADASSSATELAASVEEVAKNAGALTTAVEDTASSIGEMIASIKQVSENTDTVATAAEQTSSSLTQMGASVKEVEQRAVESARLTEKVSEDVSERGMVAATEAIKGMQNIKEAVAETAAVVNRLGARSQEIGQILKVIDDVTDQTSLLALNAAILAARAGEHGKGFAVVAEEIKDLAERTASSTQEIAGLIVSVQEETSESVQAMGKGLQAVEDGVSLVNETSDVLRQVVDSSRQAADMARAIEKTTAEQAKSVAQVLEASVVSVNQIEQIARALQDQRKGSEQIAQAAERMREITLQVKTAVQEQTTGSRQIAAAVESVTTQASHVARSTAEQNQGMRQISETISKIQKINQAMVDASIEINVDTQALKEKAEVLQAELNGFKF